MQRYANLFWVLWACLFLLTQNDSIILRKTSIFICIQNMNCIIPFFLAILYFKEFCNLIGWQYFGHNSRPKLCQICWSNINHNISSRFRLFPRKTNIKKFFKKYKNPYFGAILDSFCPNLGKYEFSWKKKGLSRFFNIPIICHCAKNQNNLTRHSGKHCWTDKPKICLFH